jgi:hypothetical protein
MTTPATAPQAVPTRAIATVLSATRAAVRRFPLVVAAGMIAAAAASTLVGAGHHPDALRLLAIATLALPLLFTVTVLAEQRAGSAAHWLLLVVALAVLALFWRRWPNWTQQMQAYRYVQLSAELHLLAAFAPWVRSRGTNGFWQFNKMLMLRVITTAIYSGVLFAGLAIALAAIDKLFGANVPPETYARLWFVLVFVFGTCFLVGGVPANLDALETDTDYPSALRAFTQFVLVPLVAVYLLILTVYLVKVLVTQQWPSGWIGYLVSSVAVVGTLSWLLVHPLEERPEYGWVKPFTRGFYGALMPAIAMLLVATWQRVQQYGITEPRYFLIVLSLWLAAIAMYYTFSRSRNIKLIPGSLCLLALVTIAGPTGAYSVSRANQAGRLQRVLERNALIANGHLQRATGVVPDSDRVAITSGFSYLVDIHGVPSIGPWLSDSLRQSLAADTAVNDPQYGNRSVAAILASINVAWGEPRRTGRAGDAGAVNFFLPSPHGPMDVTGFTVGLHVNFSATRDSVRLDDRTTVRLARDSATIQVVRDGALLFEIPLRAALDSAQAQPQVVGSDRSTPALRIEGHGDNAAAALYLTQLNGTRRGGKLTVTVVAGELFVRLP